MGNLRHLRRTKDVAKPIAMANTHMVLNECRIYMGSPDPAKAKHEAKMFGKFLTSLMKRARIPNMSDVYAHHFEMCDRFAKGETIESIIGE
jgi:hypothetical protein